MSPALSGNLLIAYYVAVDFEQKGGGSVTSEQLPQLAALVKNGAPGAALELWNGVHLFIEREARRYAAAFAGQTTPEDLTQTGYFAMLDAADIYDEGRGASFLKALRFCLQKRFAEEVGVRSSRRDVLQYAASADAPAYLLTANDDIYRRTANCFCRHGIEFGYAALKNISPHNYALFMAARDLYEKTESITMADLAEPEIIDPEALRLIVNATLIARYGLAAFQIRARGAEYER